MPLFLREWRKFRKMNQDALAELSKLNRATISQLENRQIPINERYLYDLSDALGCEPMDLLLWNPLEAQPLSAKLSHIPPSRRHEAGRILDVLAEKPHPEFEYERSGE